VLLLPAPVQVSRKEVDKQTQKIRSAAAPEERAAIEQADMEQLSRQLQQLDHAPIGRAARAAWLKEKRQQPQPQEQGPAALPRTISSPSADSAGDGRDADSSNPFAIPQEVRANWDSDMDEARPRVLPAGRRQPASRAPAQPSSGGGSRSSSRSGSRTSSSPAGAGAGSDNPFAIPRDVRVQWEAEDHMYAEPAKPILGNVIGGLLTKMTSGKAQSDAAQQHRQRRQQALRAEAVEAAAILRLQQQQEQQQQHQQQSGRSAPQGLAGSGLQQRQQPPGAVRGSVTAPAAEPAAASSAAAGAEGLEEGSPEWEEHMRQEMLRSGAARRARLQQMRAQGGQGQARGGGAAGSGSSALSAVSAADAASVTAAIPAAPKAAPAAGAAGVEQPSAGGAGSAAAGRQQKVDRSTSPYTV
jgi:hypothetical protein